MDIDSTTLILILTISTGFLGLLLKYSFKSKCDSVNLCCGCIKVHREVSKEEPEIRNEKVDIET